MHGLTVGKASLNSAIASNADRNFRALDQSFDGIHDTVSDADAFYCKISSTLEMIF